MTQYYAFFNGSGYISCSEKSSIDKAMEEQPLLNAGLTKVEFTMPEVDEVILVGGIQFQRCSCGSGSCKRVCFDTVDNIATRKAGE